MAARFGATSILVLFCAMPALADELPSRKPGLWEVKTSLENRNGPPLVIQQCIDAATDRMMVSIAGPYSQEACSKRNVQNSATAVTIDSICTVGGKTATAHAAVTGSFDSTYTMVVTSQSEGPSDDKVTMTMVAKWLGPCTADQKPGDMIMGNSMKFNILDLQKYRPSPDIPSR
jgi:hypothetical protein